MSHAGTARLMEHRSGAEAFFACLPLCLGLAHSHKHFFLLPLITETEEFCVHKHRDSTVAYLISSVMRLLHQTPADSLPLVLPSQAVGGMPGESQFNVRAEECKVIPDSPQTSGGVPGGGGRVAVLRSIPGSGVEMRRER